MIAINLMVISFFYPELYQFIHMHFIFNYYLNHKGVSENIHFRVHNKSILGLIGW